ncbi:kinetochore-associated protein 1 isoform X3 [Silurus meridionalis]|uniref:kinetochore-associated protein 1 isoform X3 n=1 Tax=Silurus meridionalis TaxID=175797 RepID=UPI001EEBDE5E|nr:kinetochore-associated protein 1 isoform X3 [Silurus meridionalis]
MWNNVDLLVNEDTGTVRLCGEQEPGSALYQVDTPVRISASEKLPDNSRIYAFNNANCCVVVADRTVILFDPSFQTVLHHLYFDTLVDVVSVCPQGQFLFVGERNGNLHIIHVPLKKTILSKVLQQPPSNDHETTYKSLLLHEAQNSPGSYHLFVLVRYGFLHVSNLALDKTQKAIEKMDLSALNEIQGNIHMNFCSTKEISNESCISAALAGFGKEVHLLIGAHGENTISQWRMEFDQRTLSLSNVLDSTLMPGVRKVQAVDNLMYVLNEEDMLSLWDTRSLVMLSCWPDLHILDFLLIAEGDSASIGTQEGTCTKIMTLTAAETKPHLRKLLVQSLPSMEVLYSLEVSAVSSLVQNAISVDAIYLLEAISDQSASSSEGSALGLVLRCFSEALPENRLNRLLYKHKFEEAEKFAIAFELDVELVYKVKLDFVMEKLALVSLNDQADEVGTKLVEEAKTNLMKIMDEQYVVQYCLNAFWPTLTTAEEMLNYAASRFPSSQIQSALGKLATFCSLYGSDKFNGVSWIEFLNSRDYLKEILAFLRMGNLSKAQYLWLRHEAEFAGEFGEKSMQALLSSISSDIPSLELCIWLRGVVVPFMWRVLPKGQRILAKWLELRARDLELTEKHGWPQNGLMLAELGLPSFWMSTNLVEDYNTEEVEHLKSLVANLHQLCDLYTKYNCRLSLSDFEMGSTRSMAFLMLDKVLAPELIAGVVESSVSPYALEHRLDLDRVLLDYIKDLLDCCSSQTTSLFTEWEAKAVALVHCMIDIDLVMDAVLEIMYKAVVPWNDTIEKLVQQHLEKEHPKQELLKESYRLMEMKKLLRCYGIRNLTLSNTRETMMLVRHIMKQDLATSLEDSLKLAETYKLNSSEIYYIYCIQLLEKNERDKCIAGLKKLPPAEAELVIERLTSWAKLQLQNKEQINELKKLQMHVAQTMVEALKYLQNIQRDDALKRMGCENNLKMFTAIAHLQEDFDIFLTPEEYDDPAVRRQFNQQLITAYENTRAWRHSKKKHPDKTSAKEPDVKAKAAVANDPDGKTRTLSTEAGLHRLARHLERTEQELWADLADRALEAGNVEKALKILSELYQHHPNSSTGRVLFSTARRLCQMLEDNVPMVLPERVNLPALIHKLACQAITICHADLLLDCVELCKSTRDAADVYRQCQIDDYGFVVKDAVLNGEEDAYTETSVQEVFNEDGIVLDPVSVLPVQYKITASLLPLADSTFYPLGCSCLSYCALQEDTDYVRPLLGPMATMLQSLQECSQLELALRLLQESYGSILQHFVSNNMDLSLSMKLHPNSRLVRDKQTLEAIEKTALSSINMVVVSLLHKVLNWRVVDCDLAIGFCTVLGKSDVLDILWKIITNAWQNYDKIMAVAMVGAHLCSLYNDQQEKKNFLSVITDAEWGIKLGKFGISIQSVFRQCSESKRNLIPVLVKNRNMTPEILKNYCRTYGLDSDSALNLYITTLLLQEKADHKQCEVGAGDSVLDEGDEHAEVGHEDVLEHVLRIVPQLSSTADLVISLHTALTKLSPYNYERIERVLKTIQSAEESTTVLPLNQMMGLLQHLKSHKRTSPPTDVESTYLLENSMESTPLANTRLPFHLLLQTNLYFWKIISPELNEETLPTILLISKLMKVNLDKLYILTVNHVFKNKLMPLLLDQMKRSQAHGPSRDTNAVIQNIFRHTVCIQNLELAAATVHKIAQDVPAGSEKTMFLKFSLDLVHKLLKSDTLQEELRTRGEMFTSKLQLQYQRSATENALMTFQLDCPELLKLTGLPGRLIVALFEHSSVVERMKSPAGKTYPDIHAVAAEIASINCVDLLKIRNILLEKWLCKTGQTNGKDVQYQDSVTDLNDDPDLMRVVYLLQMHPMDMRARLLSPILSAETWLLGGSGLRLTFEHRSRALLCLIHIADSETLEALSHTPRDKVKYYLKCYMYLSQLEALNIPYNLERFLSSPKEGMIKGLWKNHSNEPQAVRLVADLCLEYEVYDTQLWSGVLQKLLAFNMISYLQKILETLRAVPSLLELPNFSRTWRSVILAPFITASLPLSPVQQATFYKTFVLLLKCPFLLNLDLVGIAKRFAQFNLVAFSLGTLLLIPCSRKREQQIQTLLLSCNPTTILDQLVESMGTGELAGFPSQIRDTVLTFLFKSGRYQSLITSEHFRPLLKHLVLKAQRDQVEEMINYLNNHNRKGDAISLAQEYVRFSELKGGERGAESPAGSDPIKEFLAQTMDSRG